MTQRKSERIMNLAICLLMARRFIEKSQIRQVVEGYHDLSDAAFERTFERDKDELRALGVPVETGSNNPLFPDEIGYRIRRKDFELPPIEFSAGETAALGLATRVWESATQAEQAVSALAKLRAAGVDPDPGRLAGLAPTIGAREPAFAGIWAATIARTPISFSYRGETRKVEPWAMTYRRGAWYLLGYDRDRADQRMFKVARVDGPAKDIGKAGSYQVPEIDLDAAWGRLEPATADTEAVVDIRTGSAAQRRLGARLDDSGGAAPPGYQRFRIGYSRDDDVVADLCSYGADVLVVAPPALRQAVLAQLTATAGSSS